ncbi:MAG: hypothetical protein P4M13_05560 [Alphaproteobacteria bacterium]|nr:hypothetical protein [Alphaproteobacteria bacterium]
MLQRYGAHVSLRIRNALTPSELDEIDIDHLQSWLEVRAESAHEEYLRLLSNPLSTPEHETRRTAEACRRWREAEDLAYLVVIAEDVGANARAVL